MPRPDDNGARLRFSGPHPSGDESKTLTFILGLPGLKAGQPGKELPTTITVIEEGSGRFFGTPDASGCWTDVTSQQLLANDEDHGYQISGVLYCASPLAEMNSNANLSFTELTFTGRLSWEPPFLRFIVILCISPLSFAQVNSDGDLDAGFSKATLVVSTSRDACYRFDVYLALDTPQRQRGLMFVRDMPEFTGMLFEYRSAGVHLDEEHLHLARHPVRPC